MNSEKTMKLSDLARGIAAEEDINVSKKDEDNKMTEVSNTSMSDFLLMLNETTKRLQAKQRKGKQILYVDDTVKGKINQLSRMLTSKHYSSKLITTMIIEDWFDKNKPLLQEIKQKYKETGIYF